MKLTASIIFLGLLASASAVAQGRQNRPAPDQPLMFEIAARSYLEGGRVGSLAGDSAVDQLESYIWIDRTQCGMGSGDDAPSSTPWMGWHITGKVVSQTAAEMRVQFEWRRVWENGARVDKGASGGGQLTAIRSGERIELDRIVPPSAGRCGTVETKLEASVSPRAPYLMGVPGGIVGGVVGGGVASGTMSGTARGAGGVAAGPMGGAGRGRGTATGGGRGGGTGGAGTMMDQVAQLRAQAMRDAEIWLVHKRPDGTESVQQQTVRIGRSGTYSLRGVGSATAGAGRGSTTAATYVARMNTQFVFPPVQIPGAQGTLSVDISGSVHYSNDPKPNLLVISIARRARQTTPFVDTRGATDISVEMPKDDDVLSFELPPLQKSAEDLLKGHTFSIRLRLRPA